MMWDPETGGWRIVVCHGSDGMPAIDIFRQAVAAQAARMTVESMAFE